MNGRVLGPKGNDDPVMAPYGNYPCRGGDRWVSIAVRTEEKWQGLKWAMGEPEWTGEPAFASRHQRLKHRRELDRCLSTWTASRPAQEVTEVLQAHGVAAAPVMGAEERLFNPHCWQPAQMEQFGTREIRGVVEPG